MGSWHSLWTATPRRSEGKHHHSESVGAGPGFVWIPKFGAGKLTVLGKWMHDFSAKNRFESDYVTLTGSWKF